jgi:hypothetical protein
MTAPTARRLLRGYLRQQELSDDVLGFEILQIVRGQA